MGDRSTMMKLMSWRSATCFKLCEKEKILLALKWWRVCLCSPGILGVEAKYNYPSVDGEVEREAPTHWRHSSFSQNEEPAVSWNACDHRMDTIAYPSTRKNSLSSTCFEKKNPHSYRPREDLLKTGQKICACLVLVGNQQILLEYIADGVALPAETWS